MSSLSPSEDVHMRPSVPVTVTSLAKVTQKEGWWCVCQHFSEWMNN